MRGKRGELYRNPSTGKIAGVCSGIAEYFGWETWLVRILVVSGVLFGMPFLIFGYIAGWFILDKKSSKLAGKGKNRFQKGTTDNNNFSRNANYANQAAEVENESIKVKARIWQAGEPPKQAFHDIRRKFRSLEKKLQSIEHYVTSAEFTVSREINKL